jgi:hypothetical protein
MRTLACALTVAAAFALTGCVALTSPASNVSQTSARLNANGHSDDSPAHFYFRYADGKADLQTAAALRTPQHGVPAHVPEDGSNLAFWENVTQLSPGRLYWFEVCGGDSGVSPDACGGVRHFFTPPTSAQDWVLGSFRFGGEFGLIVTIDAAAGPQGQNADGWFTNSVRDLGTASEGEVTCLAVQDGSAALGVVGTAYGPPNKNPRPYSAVWTLRDDQTFHEAITQSPPNCAGASFDQQQGTSAWSIAVSDAN